MDLDPLRDALRKAAGRPLVVAHRGAWGPDPENSLGAVAKARPFDMVEVDVRLSADGTPHLMHDPTLARMTGVPAPSSSLADADLFALALREGAGGGGAAMTRERVPHLDAALSAAPDLYFDLDVKEEEDLPAVGAYLAAHPARHRCMLKRTLSGVGDIAAIRGLEDYSGATVIGKIVLSTEADVELVEAAAAAGIAGLEAWFASLNVLKKAIGVGVPITTYTLDDVHCVGLSDSVALVGAEPVWGLLSDLGLSAIMTDHPDALATFFATELA